MARYLRFAAAAFFAVLALAFVALWVRSYWWWDLIIVDSFRLSSAFGVITLGAFDDGGGQSAVLLVSQAGIAREIKFWRIGVLGFDFVREYDASKLLIPHWFLVLLSASLAALFAFKKSWRFTVRGLLIGTTIVAAALGLAVWAA